jgi:hypothetical protein
MSNSKALAIFDTTFLQTRAKLLEVAATLDRLDRSEGSQEVDADSRMAQIREAVTLIQSSTPNRAEQSQLLFSDTYDEGWVHPGTRD